MQGQTEMYLLSAKVTRICSLLKNNVITVEDYARSPLHRIDQRNDIVKAWAYPDAQQILRQARALDRVPPAQRGPLHGLAIAIKDSINTKVGWFKSPSPSSCVLTCKTTTPELTWLNSGSQTTNPRDVNRTPGGSSTGSAAAVADVQVPLSIGTQTGGSLICPASYTSIFAMKPTYNAISLEGQKTCSISLDTPAFMETPMWDQAGPGTITAMNTTFSILHKHGIKIDHVSFPPEYRNSKILTQNFTIYETDAQSSFGQEYNIDKTKLHPEIRALVETTSHTPQEYSQALKYFVHIRKILTSSIFSQYDAILALSVQMKPLSVCTIWEVRYSISSGQCVYLIFLPYNHPPPHPHPHLITSTNSKPHTLQPAKINPHARPHYPRTSQQYAIGLSLIAAPFCDQNLLYLAKCIAEPLMSEGGWEIDVPVYREREGWVD
ncbi:hypothetical protein BPOR_0529g00050 [Botrytis porri]|uniref:Amidase domain-containing protein n=1 Tax=Botrytis porri TaxID=87229 RepID=A0A4Z1KDV8_9HELO|nr:hypothetical protein BPOR_0529g00050 [Botrytis porri]